MHIKVTRSVAFVDYRTMMLDFWHRLLLWFLLLIFGSRALRDAYFLSTCLSVILWFCQFVILSGTLGLNISETRPDSGMVPIDSIYEHAYGLSIGHAPNDVTWPDDVIMATSWFLKNASSAAILVRIGRYFNTVFPCMVYLYGPHG